MLAKQLINKNYFPALGRIFSPIVLDNLAYNGYSPYLNEVCLNSGLLSSINPNITLGQFLDQVYNFLFKNYRNEYIYKNVLVNKILLGKHSLNTSYMLTEFRVGKSKADVVLLNGTSTVYEIKSEYDSLSRLQTQILSYSEVFDFINVITTNNQAKKIETILPNHIGILVLNDRNTISEIRKAKSNKKNVKSEVLFDSLRKHEYIEIIKSYYGTIPDVPNTRIFKECKDLFCKIKPVYAHDLVVENLKKINRSNVLNNFFKEAPLSLSAYAINNSNQENKIQKLMSLFNISLGNLLGTNQNEEIL